MTVLPYLLANYRPLNAHCYAATITRPHGARIGAVTVDTRTTPDRFDLSFVTPSVAREFTDWARRVPPAPLPTHATTRHPAPSRTATIERALHILRTAAHLNRYAGTCYLLDGDPMPWDSGTVRRLPTTILRQTARHALQTHYAAQHPRVWDVPAQTFRPVEVPAARPHLLAPPPVTPARSWENCTQLGLFTLHGATA